ncbi:GNAT family N-acetyltransferase [Sphaerisporangium sp. NPDC005288]|uniref:GNAT family N-acetyltransferase n=1 Tax=unclassified Sphaerisporangium TaxID=2630420 RepID=UPI0033AE66F0
METLSRRTIADAGGRPVLSYVEGTRAGRPYADLVEVLGPGALDLILRDMPGWVVSGDEKLGRLLIEAGGRPLRHAHVLSRDLRADPAPPGWAETGHGVVACEAVPPAEVFPAWRAAYPPGHPDRDHGDDATVLRRALTPLLSGASYGPLLPCGGLLLHDQRVVAGVMVGRLRGEPPFGGPWVLDVFRDPRPPFAGLGAVMLRRALALATLHGLAALGLAVTDGNPARRLYERLGFRLISSSITVIVPG